MGSIELCMETGLFTMVVEGMFVWQGRYLLTYGVGEASLTVLHRSEVNTIQEGLRQSSVLDSYNQTNAYAQ